MNKGKIIVLFLIMFTFSTNIIAMEKVKSCLTDSLTISQLFKTAESGRQYERTFQTEETTVQSHDGQPVYSCKRTVEYKINCSAEKIVVKRRVLTSDATMLCEDKEIQRISPDLTAKLLSSILTPRKIKTKNERSFQVSSAEAEQGGRTIFIDKLAQRPVKDDSSMGVTMKLLASTEELSYAPGCTFLNQLTAVKSRTAFTLTEKSGTSHKVEITETISLKQIK